MAAAAKTSARDTTAEIGFLTHALKAPTLRDARPRSCSYLSGNVREKLEHAENAARDDPGYAANVAALREVLPVDLEPEDIVVRLGGWVGRGHVQQFLRETLANDAVVVEHAGGTQWAVRGGNLGVAETETWGTVAMPAVRLAEKLLRGEPVQIYTETADGQRQLDLEGTEATQRKAAELNERFAEWAWEQPERATALAAEYNRRFNAIVLRSYEEDGARLSLPGLARSFTPRPHQLAAVARMIQEPAAGLYHVVGAGKTAEMAIGVMELRRLGTASKPAIVVPNHLVEQFRSEFLQLYPQAKVLAAGMEDVTRLGRGMFLGRVANGDWDAVIVSRTVFERIPLSVEAQRAYFERESTQIRTWLESARSQGGLTVKRLEKSLLRQEESLKKATSSARDEGLTFEQTGIDYLVVDEAHGYKNLRTPSAIQDLAIEGSKRATDLDMKLDYLRSRGDRVGTFATGTPIANSMTEAYVMQSYLRPDVLRAAGIDCFDQWAATFAEPVSEIEVAPTGGFRMKTRFAKFVNVPELLRMFHISADIRTAEDLNLPRPELVDGSAETVTVPAAAELAVFMAEIVERADKISPRAQKGTDNALVLMTESRHAALDLRLLGREVTGETKLDAAADRIITIWQDHADTEYVGEDGRISPGRGGLQIVFSDLGTPKAGFNVYDELRTALALRGMPSGRIRFVHEARNDREKAELFASCRRGEVSVLVGSTEKMGAGTNIQARAIAEHHLDVPWRPADVEQREGRILRQGNQNEQVRIIRWVTEKSFDAYMWQALERKAKFIGQLMRGQLDVREIEDIGETALSYGEIKALAAGDPLLLEKAQAGAELATLRRLERAHERSQQRLEWQILGGAERAKKYEAQVEQLTAAVARRIPTKGDAFTMHIAGLQHDKRPDAGSTLQTAVAAFVRDLGPVRSGSAPIGDLGGFALTVAAERKLAGLEVMLSFEELPYATVSITVTELGDPNKAVGLISRLEHRLNNFEARLDEVQREAIRDRDEMQRMKQRIGLPFPHRAALTAATERVKDIDARLAAAARPVGTAPSALDPAEPQPGPHSATERAVRLAEAAFTRGPNPDGHADIVVTPPKHGALPSPRPVR